VVAAGGTGIGVGTGIQQDPGHIGVALEGSSRERSLAPVIGGAWLGTVFQDELHGFRMAVVGGQHQERIPCSIGQGGGSTRAQVGTQQRRVPLPGSLEERVRQSQRVVVGPWIGLDVVGHVRGPFRNPVWRPTTWPASGATMSSWAAG
jgi:hypothetical protein